jgi:hypothetical protein
MIPTRRVRRPLRATQAEPPVVVPARPAPGSPREIARKMALEGAIRLARIGALPTSAPLVPVIEPTSLSRPRHGPFAGFRPAVRTIVATIALLLTATALKAQVASANPAALGMGENYTAAARGLDAVAWNPSVLGLSPGRTSFVTLAVRGASGLGPVTLGNLSDYSNVLVPDLVKQAWLSSIIAGGGQAGSGGADITWLGLQLGHFAVQASSSARLIADVSPGTAELILFGNVDANGAATNLDLSGSSLAGLAWSAVGASFSQPIPTDGGFAAVGVTVKYIVGHGMALGRNSTGAALTSPIGVHADFPLVHSDFNSGSFGFNNGHGVGVDVGASLLQGNWTISGVVRNVVNSFAWNPARLSYRPLSIDLSQNQAVTQTDAMVLAAAPAAVQAEIEALAFKPVFAAGLEYRYAPDLRFTADARFSATDGILIEPSRHVGAGLEFLLTDWLPLRLGGAMIAMGENADGWQAGAGFGLNLGPLSLSASAMRQNTGRLGDATIVMISMFGSGH